MPAKEKTDEEHEHELAKLILSAIKTEAVRVFAARKEEDNDSRRQIMKERYWGDKWNKDATKQETDEAKRVESRLRMKDSEQETDEAKMEASRRH